MIAREPMDKLKKPLLIILSILALLVIASFIRLSDLRLQARILILGIRIELAKSFASDNLSELLKNRYGDYYLLYSRSRNIDNLTKAYDYCKGYNEVYEDCFSKRDLLMLCYSLRGNLDKCQDEDNDILACSSNNFEISLLLASFYNDINQKTKAREAVIRAEKTMPENVPANDTKRLYLRQLKNQLNTFEEKAAITK